jgi:hypothetical protein
MVGAYRAAVFVQRAYPAADEICERHRFSSGVVEGMNNTAKVTMRRSHGFRTFRILELPLYHSLAYP